MKLECTGKEFLKKLSDLRCDDCPLRQVCHYYMRDVKSIIFEACCIGSEKLEGVTR